MCIQFPFLVQSNATGRVDVKENEESFPDFKYVVLSIHAVSNCSGTVGSYSYKTPTHCPVQNEKTRIQVQGLHNQCIQMVSAYQHNGWFDIQLPGG